MFNLIFANFCHGDSYDSTIFNLPVSFSMYHKKIYLSSQKTQLYVAIYCNISRTISHQRETDNRQIFTRFSTVFFSLSLRFFRAVKSDRLSSLRGIPLFVKEESSLFFLVRNNRLSLSAVKILIRCETREKRGK